MEDLFKQAEEYESILNQGLSLAGESKDYYIEGRIDDLKSALPENYKVNRILDYGCGTGETTVRLKSCFPTAEVIGSEISEASLSYAKIKNQIAGVTYVHIDELDKYKGHFDLAYTNGVFHHIPVSERAKAYSSVYDCLRNQGYLGFSKTIHLIQARVIS